MIWSLSVLSFESAEDKIAGNVGWLAWLKGSESESNWYQKLDPCLLFSILTITTNQYSQQFGFYLCPLCLQTVFKNPGSLLIEYTYIHIL